MTERPTDGSVVRVLTAEGREVAGSVTVASGLWSRFLGLMGRRGLGEGEGLLLVPCGSIHMFFMRIPLDVAFLDRDRRVVRTVHGIRPWRATLPVRHARQALEVAAGGLTAAGVEVGSQLDFAAPLHFS